MLDKDLKLLMFCLNMLILYKLQVDSWWNHSKGVVIQLQELNKLRVLV